MDKITTHSKSNHFVEVEEEFILDDTPKTRTVFKASMHTKGIRGDIIRYRKKEDGSLEKITPVNFNSLHPNEGIKITLCTEAVHTLYERIKELELVLKEQGIQYGIRDFTLVDESTVVVNEQNKAEVIQSLLEANYGEEVWEQLRHFSPDIATKLANSKIQENRMEALNCFQEMLQNNDLKESDWQTFFEGNTWIFGYGLRYQFLQIIQPQPNYGGYNLTGRGGQRGDFLAATEAATKFTCLVEIKKPTSLLLQRSQYRNGAWGISDELSGAVSQIQVNCVNGKIKMYKKGKIKMYSFS